VGSVRRFEAFGNFIARQRCDGLGAGCEFLLDRALGEDCVGRQTVLLRNDHLTFDQRGGIFDELLVRQESVFANPVARDEVLDIGDVLQRFELDFQR